MVGAGMAGLAAARLLADAGLAVTVLERESRVGGRVLTVDLGGSRVDAGASHVWSFYECTRRWLQRYGLLADLQPASGLGALPLRVRDLPGVARSVLEVARWWRHLDWARPELASPLDTASIADYAARHLPPGFAAAALRPAFEWNAFCSLDQLSQVLLFQAGRLYLRARPSVLHGGLERLPMEMSCGLDIRLGAAGDVRGVRSAPGGVVLELASGAAVSCRAAVIATTPREAAELAGWSPAISSFLREIRHSMVTRAWWELPAAAGDPGQVVRYAATEPRLVLAAARRQAVIRVAAAAYGEAAAAVQAGAGEAISQQMTGLAQALLPALGGRSHLSEAGRYWESAVTLFAPGHFRRLAALRPGRLVGPVVLAGDYLVSPTVEGAILSGERAVAELVRSHILEGS
ncbi:MAG: FAD-dependent oxidoreductase [Candidatus Dormibacteria bacterium]